MGHQELYHPSGRIERIFLRPRELLSSCRSHLASPLYSQTFGIIIGFLVPAFLLIRLINAYPPSLFSPIERVDLVISHYDEWDDREPSWLKEFRASKRYTIQDGYQRRLMNLSTYVPNYGFESGVYLRYIVDHYLHMPPVIVFIQADACGIDVSEVLSRLDSDLLSRAGGYVPLNCNKVLNRGFEVWQGNMAVQTCWSSVVEHFKVNFLLDVSAHDTRMIVDGDTRVNIVCCACFAVSRDLLRLTPYETWASFYNQAIEGGSCVRGRKDSSLGKHETAGAIEHLAHMIFGRKQSLWDPKCIDDYYSDSSTIAAMNLKENQSDVNTATDLKANQSDAN